MPPLQKGWRLRDIQRWSALIQNTFRSVSALFITWNSLNSADSALNSAENGNFQSSKSALKQRCFSSDFLWNSACSELNSADFHWNSADFWIIQNDKYWLPFHFFHNFSKYLNFEAHYPCFQASLRNYLSNNGLLLHFRIGQRYNKYLNFWVYCYCSSNKTDMVQLFKNIFAFIGMKFQAYFKKFESLLSICRIFTFSSLQEYHFNDHFVRFQHFRLRYHILIVLSTYVNIRADSE